MSKADAGLRAIVECLPGAFVVFDHDGVISMFGGRDAAMVVRTPDAVGQPAQRVFAAEPVLLGYLDRCLKGEAITADVVIGSAIFTIAFRPLGADDAPTGGAVAHAVDATSRYDLQAQLAVIFDRAPVAIAMLSADGVFLHANHRMLDIVGYSDRDLRQMRMRDVTYPGDWDQELSLRREALASGADYYELRKRFKRKDGRVALAISQTQFLRGRDGQPSFECAIIRDIGRNLRMEQQLERNRWRMEVISRFVDGLAYDLRFLRRRQESTPSTAADPLVDFWDAARLDALLAFLDRKSPDDEEVAHLAPVSLVIEERVMHWQERVKDDIRISAQIDCEFACVRMVRDDLAEMLDHLISNACFAVNRGGAITISAELVELPQPATDRFMHLYPGSYVQIGVSDDGVGMPPEVAERVWEPFFSAWPSRPTTGVGLTLVKAIARRWDGDAALETLPGFGSSLTVALPAAGMDD